MMKNAFYFILKAFFILKIYRKNGLIGNKFNFKIYAATTLLTNDYHTHVARSLMNYRQPDNEIRSINRMKQEKYFSSKIMQKMRQED